MNVKIEHNGSQVVLTVDLPGGYSSKTSTVLTVDEALELAAELARHACKASPGMGVSMAITRTTEFKWS